jgi:hypothetical protein
MIGGMRWQQKPPKGTQLDWGYPLARGLQAFYPLNEGTGGLIGDACRNLNLAATGFGSTNPWGSGSGPGIVDTISGASVSATVPTPNRIGWPVTIATGFRFLGTQPDNCTIFGITYTTSVSSPFWVFAIYTVAQNVTLRWNNSGSPAALQYLTDLSNNVDHVASAVFTATTQSLYIDGVLAISGTTSGGNPSYSASSLIGFNTLPGTPNRVNYWGGIWNSAQPPAWHAAIGSSVNAIWQIMQPPLAWQPSVWPAPTGTSVYWPGSSVFRPTQRVVTVADINEQWD